MAGGISIHAVDVASGRPAQGLRVEIWRIESTLTRIAEGRLGANGQLDHPVVGGVGKSKLANTKFTFTSASFSQVGRAPVSSPSRLSVSGLRKWMSIFICQ